jgi:hypothetical protein
MYGIKGQHLVVSTARPKPNGGYYPVAFSSREEAESEREGWGAGFSVVELDANGWEERKPD